MKNSILRTRSNISDHSPSSSDDDTDEDEDEIYEKELKSRKKSLKIRNLPERKSNENNLHSATDKDSSKLNKSLSSYPRACEFCGKICAYRQVFFAHRKKCNSHTNYSDLLVTKSTIIREYICYHCNKHFNRKFNLQKHLESGVCVKRKSDCCNDTSKPHDHSEDLSTTIENDENKEYSCQNCGKIFRKKCNLQRHVNRSVCSDKDAVKRCKLKCWENECSALFYKQIDLVQHLREHHGRTLGIERLEFPDLEAFEKWKNEENSIKFMNARKLTGSKRSSRGLSYYYVCQFYRKNETESTKRKTNRRKSVGIVPNTKCPSRILVKECGSKIHVTYISSHNHDLYDPLEKKPLSMSMISLVKKRHVSGMKFKDECVRAKLNDGAAWEISCGNDDKLRKYVVRRVNETCLMNDCVVKCYEEHCCNLCEHLYKCSCSKKNIFCKHMHKIHSVINRGLFIVNIQPENYSPPESPAPSIQYDSSFQPEPSENEKLLYSAQNSLVKLNSLLSNDTSTIEPSLLKLLAKSLQDLCDQCDQSACTSLTQQQPVPNEINLNAAQHKTRIQRSFTVPITETTDCLKPIRQPCNISLLCLKSLDPYIPERESRYLKTFDSGFSAGWLYDSVVDSFLSIVCPTGTNVYVVDTRVSQFILNDQRPPDIWNWVSWNNIDLLVVPCKPNKNHWLLLIILLKEHRLYVLDPSTPLDSLNTLYKKYSNIINCWSIILKNFFGVFSCDIASLPHTEQNEPCNCGVFICWYAYQYVNKFNLTDDLNTDAFRKFIHDTIVNGPQAM
ncbi:uncharacterized protein LOC135848663 [Planococcus citri]|uniref:uncharacterized protein LOC135848663 n=1 Tax=Planococcus citri TaxID=170843 RepID=UPI0031F8143C